MAKLQETMPRSFEFLTKAVSELPLEEQFEGKVDSLFQDDRDHNIKKAVIGSRYVYSMPRKWEGIIEVGDSLVKKKNTLELSVYRQGQLKRVLNYRDTYKKE